MNSNQEKEIDEQVKSYLNSMGIYEDYPGYIQLFWNIKKEQIKRMYKIDWNSPSDIDEDSIFN